MTPIRSPHIPIAPPRSSAAPAFACHRCGGTDVELQLAPGSANAPPWPPSNYALDLRVERAHCATCQEAALTSALPRLLEVRGRTGPEAAVNFRLRVFFPPQDQPVARWAASHSSYFACSGCRGGHLIAEAMNTPLALSPGEPRREHSYIWALCCSTCGRVPFNWGPPRRISFKTSNVAPLAFAEVILVPYLLDECWSSQIAMCIGAIVEFHRRGLRDVMQAMAAPFHALLHNRARDFAHDPDSADALMAVAEMIWNVYLQPSPPVPRKTG